MNDTYPDVARRIQIAWEFGPSDSISLERLKRKWGILLMGDTAARPIDLWRLYAAIKASIARSSLSAIPMSGYYFWPEEVDPLF